MALVTNMRYGDFMQKSSWLPTSEITQIPPKMDPSIAISSIVGMVYFEWYLVNTHVETDQNMYGKGGLQRL